MRHLIDPTDLTVEETEQIVSLAEDIIAHRAKYREACKGKKLATLFYEPSTRTRLSFTSAMLELGGEVIGFSDANSSSVSKGETVADTVRVIRCFADIIAMRHFKEGAPLVASQYAGIPVINAGDGSHAHPTQTLTDLLTIKREKGRFDHLTIGFCGDLKFGRTVHSLIKALSRYEGIEVILISPEELRLPDYMLHEMSSSSRISFREVRTMEEVMPELDILYMTRVQKERFLDEEEFDRVKNSFVLDPEKLKTAKKDMIILHPLPRVNEITRAVDNDPRAAYFRQVENGKFVRMALIYTLLQWADENRPYTHTPVFSEEYIVNELECPNRRCISATEDVDQLFRRAADGTCRCAYCEAKARPTARAAAPTARRRPVDGGGVRRGCVFGMPPVLRAPCAPSPLEPRGFRASRFRCSETSVSCGSGVLRSRNVALRPSGTPGTPEFRGVGAPSFRVSCRRKSDSATLRAGRRTSLPGAASPGRRLSIFCR